MVEVDQVGNSIATNNLHTSTIVELSGSGGNVRGPGDIVVNGSITSRVERNRGGRDASQPVSVSLSSNDLEGLDEGGNEVSSTEGGVRVGTERSVPSDGRTREIPAISPGSVGSEGGSRSSSTSVGDDGNNTSILLDGLHSDRRRRRNSISRQSAESVDPDNTVGIRTPVQSRGSGNIVDGRDEITTTCELSSRAGTAADSVEGRIRVGQSSGLESVVRTQGVRSTSSIGSGNKVDGGELNVQVQRAEGARNRVPRVIDVGTLSLARSSLIDEEISEDNNINLRSGQISTSQLHLSRNGHVSSGRTSSKVSSNGIRDRDYTRAEVGRSRRQGSIDNTSAATSDSRAGNGLRN